MKRQLEIDDAGDRAQKHLKPGLVRIPLDQIGFWPGNRGGLGISSHHRHEVAWDCVANKTKLQRYGHVDLIEIPAESLQQIRDANRERCEVDDLMPRCAADIRYVCASKTHFVHAQKLARDGSRTLFNKGVVKIRWHEADSEGAQIQEQGPLSSIYSAGLLLDLDATNALSAEDNLNASVSWGEDEMQAFGRVHEMMIRMAPSQEVSHGTVDNMIKSLQVSGLGKFSLDEWREFIALRKSLPCSIAKILQTCQFNACAGRVRVRPVDFGLSAKLDPRTPWAKVAVMLWQYIGSMDQKSTSGNAHTFAGRKEIVARKLQRDVVSELVAETDFVREVNTFIIAMFQHYRASQNSHLSGFLAREMLSVRGELLANCGRYLLRIGSALEQAAKKALLKQAPLTPEERLRFLETECQGKLGQLEDYFRKQLVKRSLYTETDLPETLYPMSQSSEPTVNAPSQAGLRRSNAKIELCDPKPEQGAEGGGSGSHGQVEAVRGEAGALSEAHVYERLRVKGCGEEVLAMFQAGEKSNVKVEETNDSTGLADASEGSQPSGVSWKTVRLISVSLPQAVVELVADGGGETFSVCVDDLRPVTKVKEVKVIVHPSLQESGKVLDNTITI